MFFRFRRDSKRGKRKKKKMKKKNEAAFLVSFLEGEYPLACLVLKLVGEREELPCIIENSRRYENEPRKNEKKEEKGNDYGKG